MRSKILLAVAVIFLAGISTGSLVTRAFPPEPLPISSSDSAPPPLPPERRRDYLERLHQEVQLTPEQRAQAEQILRRSQERVRALWEPIAPKVREEYRAARREIAALLTPEQRESLQQARRSRTPRPNAPPSQIPR